MVTNGDWPQYFGRSSCFVQLKVWCMKKCTFHTPLNKAFDVIWRTTLKLADCPADMGSRPSACRGMHASSSWEKAQLPLAICNIIFISYLYPSTYSNCSGTVTKSFPFRTFVPPVLQHAKYIHVEHSPKPLRQDHLRLDLFEEKCQRNVNEMSAQRLKASIIY